MCFIAKNMDGIVCFIGKNMNDIVCLLAKNMDGLVCFIAKNMDGVSADMFCVLKQALRGLLPLATIN